MAGLERSTITEHTRVVASRSQLSTQLAGEAVILGLKDSVYYGLAGTGARIWELVQQPTALGDLADTVSREFDVGRDVALDDLLALTGDLLSRELLEVVPGAAP
ncbi:MAG: PqqD family protein [Gemmatimonadaceae bacterium]